MGIDFRILLDHRNPSDIQQSRAIVIVSDQKVASLYNLSVCTSKGTFRSQRGLGLIRLQRLQCGQTNAKMRDG